VENIEKCCNECDVKGYCNNIPADCLIAKEYKQIADFEKAKADIKTAVEKSFIKFFGQLGYNPQRIEEVATMTDNVKHPSHYTYGKIECIDFILDKELDFSLGNAVKYIVRAGRKNPEKQIEDLQKAIQYIQFEIEHLEGGR
jgi:hypothetical protein